MADAFGTSAGGFQLFEVAIAIFKRITRAIRLQKELSGIIEKYQVELESIRDLVIQIDTEKALKSSNIAPSMAKLAELERKLSAWLQQVNPGDKTSLRQFADQLVHGSKDRKKLDEIMKDLDRAKGDLNSKLQLSQLRLSYRTNKIVTQVHKKETTTTNQSSAEELGDSWVEKITVSPRRQADGGFSADFNHAQGVFTRSVSNIAPASPRSISSSGSDDGTSSGGSLAFSELDESLTTATSASMTRICTDNEAMDGAVMYNAPLEDDLWGHVPTVVIKGNVAQKGAFMVNYRMSKKDLALAREAQEWKWEDECKRRLWEREHGFEPSKEA